VSTFFLFDFYTMLAFRAWQRGQWEQSQDLLSIAYQVKELPYENAGMDTVRVYRDHDVS
jgi:hypothetical protein